MLAKPARLYALTTNLVLLLGFVLFSLVVLLPHTGAWRTYSVLSGSMSPSIPTGALVYSHHVPATSVRPGQVITYHAPIEGHPVVTHRVVSMRPEGDVIEFQTKGDANKAADPWKARIPARSMIWQPLHVVPYLGELMGAVRVATSRSMMLLLVLVALVGGILVIWRSGGERDDLRGRSESTNELTWDLWFGRVKAYADYNMAE